MPTHVLAVVEDLFFLVQIRDACLRAGCAVDFVRTPEELLDKAREMASQLAIVDLNAIALRPVAVIEAAKSAGVEVLAFAPHVRADLKQQALDAGADRVVARSNFAQHLHGALEKLSAAR